MFLFSFDRLSKKEKLAAYLDKTTKVSDLNEEREIDENENIQQQKV